MIRPFPENIEKSVSGRKLRDTQKKREDIMKPTCSILEYIRSHTKDGALPQGFSIPWIDGMWAPGAQDGVYLKHMCPFYMSNSERDKKILDALTLMAADDNMDRTDDILLPAGGFGI